MQKSELDTLAHLFAIQYVLENVAKVAFLAAGLRPKHAKAMRNQAETMLGKETFPGLEAVWSDHLADELARNVDVILSGIEEQVTSAYREMG